MHIHSYQIHNVLNVYRRQLSQGTARKTIDNPERNRAVQDTIKTSNHGQRQSLLEKISSEIVQRIAHEISTPEDISHSVDSQYQSHAGIRVFRR